MFQRSCFGKPNDFGQLSRCEAGKRATRREKLFAGSPIAQHDEPPAKLDPRGLRAEARRFDATVARQHQRHAVAETAERVR